MNEMNITIQMPSDDDAHKALTSLIEQAQGDLRAKLALQVWLDDCVAIKRQAVTQKPKAVG